jgi:hypothetical protein
VSALAQAAPSCTTLHDSTRKPDFTRDYGDYTFCEVDAVRQSAQKSCGIAALVCVLRYWDKPATESEITTRHPLRSGIGYPVQQLQAIAVENGLLAFAVSMNQPGIPPVVALGRQIARGRPVIIAVNCPHGRYFGEPLPVIESFDRRTIGPLGGSTGSAFKHHYVVVIGESPQNYLVMDPAYGIGPVRKQSLLDWWRKESYAALVCSPPPDPPPDPPPAAPAPAAPAPAAPGSDLPPSPQP